MQPFTKRVIEVIQSIPEGYVMTYGQVARLAGSPRGARQVVRILHTLSHIHKLPWHRVINAKGEIAIQDDESRLMQELYLQDEGVAVNHKGIIDLEKYRYDPAD
ncbi:methylated-DNA-protein-cysteine methyltransferase related protein [Paenibacillus sp. cl141a]|uniref:MGMT family protein n=1 Tax=Paenibacillus sp. cl141a TaxID=1761877 RepID=UPI0008B71706|nr:MGMT family protein [Paenibacillus sp. cl141a]SEK74772.1 methylated-DNA-protein-cysteine methyltransferase related protein [Paenibacillus sp. cl141a]